MKKAFQIVSLAVVVVSFSLPVSAELIETDLITDDGVYVEGNGYITYDTSTGFEWLDLNRTTAVSYDNIINSAFITDYGFQVADYDSVDNLIRNSFGWSGARFFDEGSADETVLNQFYEYFEVVRYLDGGRQSAGVTSRLDTSWTDPETGITYTRRKRWDFGDYRPLDQWQIEFGEEPYEINATSSQWDEQGHGEVGIFLVRNLNQSEVYTAIDGALDDPVFDVLGYTDVEIRELYDYYILAKETGYSGLIRIGDAYWIYLGGPNPDEPEGLGIGAVYQSSEGRWRIKILSSLELTEVVPEPATIISFLIGGLALVVKRRGISVRTSRTL
ncbi:MAG: PEP-CTERM sorting domain-containing protein [Phycisphaerae bacterium]|jgi:hypothetical protein|nr:PEP-CTERM sorting domain-containing protein [Phycisphaerae bacterium]